MIYILNLDKTIIHRFDMRFYEFIRDGSEILAKEGRETISLAKYDNEIKAERAMVDLLHCVSKDNACFEFKKYEEELSLNEMVERIKNDSNENE